MSTTHHSDIFTKVAQACKPNVNTYIFKKRKSAGIYQLDAYEYKTIESTSLMVAWAQVGYEYNLHSIDKNL